MVREDVTATDESDADDENMRGLQLAAPESKSIKRWISPFPWPGWATLDAIPLLAPIDSSSCSGIHYTALDTMHGIHRLNVVHRFEKRRLLIA